MKKIIICVFLLMLAGCTSNGAKIIELQASVDELTLVVENQKKEIQQLSTQNKELRRNIESLLHADSVGGVIEEFVNYYDYNVVNGAVDFEKLNKLSDDMNQNLVGIYVGNDDGNTVVLQIYPSGVVVYLSITSNGTQLSYDGEYRQVNGVGLLNISPRNPGITYSDVMLVNGALKMSSCGGICSPQDNRKIEFKKLR